MYSWTKYWLLHGVKILWVPFWIIFRQRWIIVHRICKPYVFPILIEDNSADYCGHHFRWEIICLYLATCTSSFSIVTNHRGTAARNNETAKIHYPNVICSFGTSLTLRPKVKSSGPETTREHDFQVFLLQIPCSTSVDCTSLVYEGRN